MIGWMGVAAAHVPLGALILAGGAVTLAQTWARSSSVATQ
jgi:hypothetical protein